jgi:Caspase domain
MSGKIYALLVGIDRYADAPNPQDTPKRLTGCVNDVDVFREYLEQKSQRDGRELCSNVLLNEKATRDAVIRGFREHLCQANSQDTAIFYYSGHGSREIVSPELKKFLQLGADLDPMMLETLVCWDSRTEESYDLVDKELAVLIAEVSQKQPEIVIILDCCHSGGLLRSNNNSVRRCSPRKNVDRPLDSFVFGWEQVSDLFPSANLDRTKSNWLTGLESNYILLAACRSDQKALEDPHRKRGVFSYFLTDSLQQANSQFSYRDIFNRTNVRVQTSYPQQSPQITATNSDYLDRHFLGRGVTNQHYYFTVSYRSSYEYIADDGWVIDGGLLHGIHYNSNAEKTRLAVFPLEVNDLRQLSLAIATAETIEVLPQLSKLNIAGEREPLDEKLTYKAVVTSTPLVPLGVYLDGDELEVNLAHEAIRTASFGEQRSLYIHEVDNLAADFHLLARGSEYTIIHPARERAEITTKNAIAAIQSLEHIAKWKNIANLASPPNSRIPSDGVKLQIYRADGVEITEPQIRLEYQYLDGKWQPPAFKVKLTNQSQETLYCALLDLTELYAVKSILLDGSSVIRLESGNSVWAFDGNQIYACIPKDMLRHGITEYKDILKLICNTSDFEARLLEQKSIADSINLWRGSIPDRTIDCQSDLLRLMSRVRTRTIVASDEPDSIRDDWVTREVLITTVRVINSTQNRGGYSGGSTLKLPTVTRGVDKASDLKHPKFNYLAIVSIGSILCLIAIFSFLIWKSSHKEERSKDRAIDRPTMRSHIINL